MSLHGIFKLALSPSLTPCFDIGMAPKSKKGANAQKSKSGEEEREEPLQAVVFADSFETKFAPFTLERPRVSNGQYE